jgi:transposase InsO family protein
MVSMFWKGNTYDNAMMGSFFKALKYEKVKLCEHETIVDL